MVLFTIELRHVKELRALVKRLGVTEVCRRSGMNYKTIRKIEAREAVKPETQGTLIDFLLRERDA